MTRLFLCLMVAAAMAVARPHAQNQEFDLLIRNGHVIDPKNGINAVMDVAVSGSKIALVASNIASTRARQVVDATGLYVGPGLIDIHAHVFWGHDEESQYSDGYSAVQPDSHSFRAGQTTLVDVGGAGWRSFPKFKEQVIDRSQTRVLSFLNIVGSGMRGGPVEQDLSDMDAKLTAMRIRQHPGLIVGVKVAHYNGPEWDPVTRAVAAGRETNVPVMVDFGGHNPPLSLEDLLTKHLRPGDILTHTYAHVGNRIPIVDENGKVRPYVWAARKRGVIFDAGHGGGSFLFRQAVPAMQQGFHPDVISTDLHIGSQNSGMKDILNTMSKFLNMGMPLADVIKANTARAAEIIKHTELGHLGAGAEADIAVLSVRKGTFGFIDVSGAKMMGDQKLECELTVKAGRVVWDLNGISRPLWTRKGGVTMMLRLSSAIRLVLLVCLSAVALSAEAEAQLASQTALVGTVTDRDGGVVPGAQVVAVNVGTKDTYEATTNAEGYYHVPFVRTGTYEITITVSGFQTFRTTGVEVANNQVVRMNAVMQIGALAESLIVTASAPMLATDSAAVSQTISERAIAELPLSGRNIWSLATATPGVVVGPASDIGLSFRGAGQREIQNSLSLDGINASANLLAMTSMRPIVDAVEEMQVQTGSTSAEYGSYLGVHINVVTKSGTNATHGSVFEFIQDDALDERGYFENRANPKNPRRRDQFGFQIGGPVVFPKLYDGHNKTFFMAAYEGVRAEAITSPIITVPTALMRQGNFSEVTSPIRNPFTGQNYPGNLIPSSSLVRDLSRAPGVLSDAEPAGDCLQPSGRQFKRR